MNVLKPFFLASLFLIGALFSQQPVPDSPELKEADALTDSVVKLFKEQKFNEALPLAKRVLEIRERLLPSGDPRIATSLGYLADVYLAKGDYGGARKALQRMLQVKEMQLGPADVKLASTVERLAMVQFLQGSYGEAEDAYKRALTLRERESGGVSIPVAQALFALGELYRFRKNFERGAPVYRRTLAIYGELSGVESSEFKTTSEAFSCLAYESNKLDSIKELRQIWKQFAGPNVVEPAEDMMLNGKALKMPKPAYPDAARERHLEGTVVVKVRIDEAGNVIDARDMCQGPPYLSESSVYAAWQARFTPTKLSGQPIKVDGVILYRFIRQ